MKADEETGTKVIRKLGQKKPGISRLPPCKHREFEYLTEVQVKVTVRFFLMVSLGGRGREIDFDVE